jgi:hypothetical protein
MFVLTSRVIMCIRTENDCLSNNLSLMVENQTLHIIYMYMFAIPETRGEH